MLLCFGLLNTFNIALHIVLAFGGIVFIVIGWTLSAEDKLIRILMKRIGKEIKC